MSSGGLMVAFKVSFESSRLHLHSRTMHMINKPSIYLWRAFLLLLFFLFDFYVYPIIFQSSLSIYFPFKSHLCSFDYYFFLFWIIYKIIIIFQFHYPLIFLHLSYLDFILLIIIFLVFYPYPYPYLFYFSITSLVILFHLICIPDLIFIFLLLFFYFPDLFYFSISFLVVLFHLFFILDVVLVSFDCYLFCFLIFDDWEFCFVTFFRYALYGVADLMTRVKFF
jgi:hypothetical protein